MTLINRLKCYFNYHDEELQRVHIQYVLYDTTGIFSKMLEDKQMKIGWRDGFMRVCKNCKKERIL